MEMECIKVTSKRKLLSQIHLSKRVKLPRKQRSRRKEMEHNCLIVEIFIMDNGRMGGWKVLEAITFPH
jgi:hypothetical protein